MTERRMDVHGLGYYVQVTGHGPPLLLLHGFTGSGRSWARIVAKLQQEYACVTVDLPGHGGTDCPTDARRYAIESVAHDLADLMAGLGWDAFACAGYSMGGRLALALALTQPASIQALVLESASPGLADPAERALRQAADDQLAAQIESHGVAEFVRQWEQLPLFAGHRRLSEERLAHQRNIRVSQRPEGLAAALRGMGTGMQPSYWDRLGELRCPVLLVTGAEDQKFCGIAAKMVEHIPCVSWEVVGEAGHTVHLEAEDAYVALVGAFLRRHVKQTG